MSSSSSESRRDDARRYIRALHSLDPNMSREDWFKVACAFKDAGGSLDEFDAWSSGGESYDMADVRSMWRSIQPGKITAGTLIAMAKPAGWSDDGIHTKSVAERVVVRQSSRAPRQADEAQTKARRNAEASERAQRIWNAGVPATDDHPYLRRKRIRAFDIRVGAWEKFNRDTGQMEVVSEQALLVPQRSERALPPTSLQAILPSKSLDKGTRDKDTLAGGSTAGLYHAIGLAQKIDGRHVIVIVEGYANGASIHEAIGHGVVVAFGKGNLLHVSKVMRERSPNADIIIFSDRDAEALDKSGGTKAALKAALASGARVVIPEWTGFKGRDANDILCDGFTWGGTTYPGVEILKACVRFATPYRSQAFMSLLRECGIEAVDTDHHLVRGEPREEGRADEEPVPLEQGDASARSVGHFTVLGFSCDKYYIFHQKMQLVLERSRTDFSTDVGLVELVARQWWEINGFVKNGGGIDKVAAAQWIFSVAHERGHFDPANRMRGRGAWNDEGRLVFHHGDHLTVDGTPMDLSRIVSRNIYEGRAPLPAAGEPATATEGDKLLATARLMRWVNPASAMLLCGWVFLAPIGGALRWRPHIWLTGEAGSGKSRILHGFAGRLLRSTKLAFDAGDSSAAGIRQKLKRDALPVLLDESESKDEAGRARIRGILTLARGSSTDSDAMIAKGTVSGRALEFVVRSMFCLCSIGAIAQEQESDNSRFTTLALRNRSDTSAPDQWARLKVALDEIDRDEGLQGRLFSRCIRMLPSLHKCIEVFAAAAAKQLGSERSGDQYGVLLAGCWCLTHDDVVTDIEAQRFVDGVSWDDYFVGQRQAAPDASKCLDTILDHLIMERGSTVSIRALVALAAGYLLDGYDIEAKTARRLLHDRGLTITADRKKGQQFLGIIRDSPPVAAMLKGSSFQMDWQSQLPRVEGYIALQATSFGNSGTNRGHGFPLSSIRLPGRRADVLTSPPSVHWDQAGCLPGLFCTYAGGHFGTSDVGELLRLTSASTAE